MIDGLNSGIQNVKTRGRGFRNMDYYSGMNYLTCGKLGLNSVTA